MNSTHVEFLVNGLRPSPSTKLNWLYLVENTVLVLILIFFLFYLSRVTGLIVSYVLRFFFWRSHYAFIDIGSVSFSLLGGRILFNDFTYSSRNQNLRIVYGEISWRYWLWKVRELGNEDSNIPARFAISLRGVEWFLFNRTDTYDFILTHMGVNPGGKGGSGAAPAQDSGVHKRSSNTTAVDTEGLQGTPNARVYGHNPSGSVLSSSNELGAGSDGAYPPSKRADVQRSALERGGTSLRSVSHGIINWIRDEHEENPFEALFDPEKGPLETKEMRWIADFLPLDIGAKKVSITLGNRSTPSLIIAGFEQAAGSFTVARARSVLDKYKQVFKFTFLKPKVVFRRNPDYERPMEDHGAEMYRELSRNGTLDMANAFEHDSWLASISTFRSMVRGIRGVPKRVGRRLGFGGVHTGTTKGASHATHQGEKSARRWTKAKGGKSADDFLSDTSGASPGAPPPPAPAWTGLSWYGPSPPRGPTHPHRADYAKVNTLLQSPELVLTYSCDVVGTVPQQPRHFPGFAGLEAIDVGNGDFAPEWGVDLLFKGGTLAYGPWADHERGQIQSVFFPATHADAAPAPRLRPGDPRVHTSLRVCVEFAETVTLRVPTREASKDWKYDTLAPTGADDMLLRPFGWIDLAAGAGSTLTYVAPLVSAPGADAMVEIHLDTISAVSSVNYAEFLSAETCHVHCDLPTPPEWAGVRNWAVAVEFVRPEVALLRDHVTLFTDLVKDWGSASVAAEAERGESARAKSEETLDGGDGAPKPRTTRANPYTAAYEEFVPFTYDISVSLRDYSLRLFVNDHNIINNPSARADNTELVIQGPTMDFSVDVPSDCFRPQCTEVPFKARFADVELCLSLPEWDTHVEDAGGEGDLHQGPEPDHQQGEGAEEIVTDSGVDGGADDTAPNPTDPASRDASSAEKVALPSSQHVQIPTLLTPTDRIPPLQHAASGSLSTGSYNEDGDVTSDYASAIDTEADRSEGEGAATGGARNADTLSTTERVGDTLSATERIADQEQASSHPSAHSSHPSLTGENQDASATAEQGEESSRPTSPEKTPTPLPAHSGSLSPNVPLENPLRIPEDSDAHLERFASSPLITLSGSMRSYAHYDPRHVESLKIDIVSEDVEFTAFGWVLRHLMNVKENYFGAFTHCVTLEEYRRRHAHNVQGDPIELKYRAETSDVSEVCVTYSLARGVLLLPQELYGCRSALAMAIPALRLDLRTLDHYMDMEVGVEPFRVVEIEGVQTPSGARREAGSEAKSGRSGHTGPGPRNAPPFTPTPHADTARPGQFRTMFAQRTTAPKSARKRVPPTYDAYPRIMAERDHLHIHGLEIVANRLFGPQPRTSTYFCVWSFELGAISGSLPPSFFRALGKVQRSLEFNMRDNDNALPQDFSIAGDPDATFLSVDVEKVDIAVRGLGTAVQLDLTQGLRLRFDDLAQAPFLKHTSLAVPEAHIRVLAPLFGRAAPWMEVASLDFEVDFVVGTAASDGGQRAQAQLDFIREQDRLTKRVLFVYDKHYTNTPSHHLGGLYVPPMAPPVDSQAGTRAENIYDPRPVHGSSVDVRASSSSESDSSDASSSEDDYQAIYSRLPGRTDSNDRFSAYGSILRLCERAPQSAFLDRPTFRRLPGKFPEDHFDTAEDIPFQKYQPLSNKFERLKAFEKNSSTLESLERTCIDAVVREPIRIVLTPVAAQVISDVLDNLPLDTNLEHHLDALLLSYVTSHAQSRARPARYSQIEVHTSIAAVHIDSIQDVLRPEETISIKRPPPFPHRGSRAGRGSRGSRGVSSPTSPYPNARGYSPVALSPGSTQSFSPPDNLPNSFSSHALSGGFQNGAFLSQGGTSNPSNHTGLPQGAPSHASLRSARSASTQAMTVLCTASLSLTSLNFSAVRLQDTYGGHGPEAYAALRDEGRAVPVRTVTQTLAIDAAAARLRVHPPVRGSFVPRHTLPGPGRPAALDLSSGPVRAQMQCTLAQSTVTADISAVRLDFVDEAAELVIGSVWSWRAVFDVALPLAARAAQYASIDRRMLYATAACANEVRPAFPVFLNRVSYLVGFSSNLRADDGWKLFQHLRHVHRLYSAEIASAVFEAGRVWPPSQQAYRDIMRFVWDWAPWDVDWAGLTAVTPGAGVFLGDVFNVEASVPAHCAGEAWESPAQGEAKWSEGEGDAPPWMSHDTSWDGNTWGEPLYDKTSSRNTRWGAPSLQRHPSLAQSARSPTDTPAPQGTVGVVGIAENARSQQQSHFEQQQRQYPSAGPSIDTPVSIGLKLGNFTAVFFGGEEESEVRYHGASRGGTSRSRSTASSERSRRHSNAPETLQNTFTLRNVDVHCGSRRRGRALHLSARLDIGLVEVRASRELLFLVRHIMIVRNTFEDKIRMYRQKLQRERDASATESAARAVEATAPGFALLAGRGIARVVGHVSAGVHATDLTAKVQGLKGRVTLDKMTLSGMVYVEGGASGGGVANGAPATAAAVGTASALSDSPPPFTHTMRFAIDRIHTHVREDDARSKELLILAELDSFLFITDTLGKNHPESAFRDKKDGFDSQSRPGSKRSERASSWNSGNKEESRDENAHRTFSMPGTRPAASPASSASSAAPVRGISSAALRPAHSVRSTRSSRSGPKRMLRIALSVASTKLIVPTDVMRMFKFIDDWSLKNLTTYDTLLAELRQGLDEIQAAQAAQAPTDATPVPIWERLFAVYHLDTEVILYRVVVDLHIMPTLAMVYTLESAVAFVTEGAEKTEGVGGPASSSMSSPGSRGSASLSHRSAALPLAPADTPDATDIISVPLTLGFSVGHQAVKFVARTRGAAAEVENSFELPGFKLRVHTDRIPCQKLSVRVAIEPVSIVLTVEVIDSLLMAQNRFGKDLEDLMDIVRKRRVGRASASAEGSSSPQRHTAAAATPGAEKDGSETQPSGPSGTTRLAFYDRAAADAQVALKGFRVQIEGPHAIQWIESELLEVHAGHAAGEPRLKWHAALQSLSLSLSQKRGGATRSGPGTDPDRTGSRSGEKHLRLAFFRLDMTASNERRGDALGGSPIDDAPHFNLGLPRVQAVLQPIAIETLADLIEFYLKKIHETREGKMKEFRAFRRRLWAAREEKLLALSEARRREESQTRRREPLVVPAVPAAPASPASASPASASPASAGVSGSGSGSGSASASGNINASHTPANAGVANAGVANAGVANAGVANAGAANATPTWLDRCLFFVNIHDIGIAFLLKMHTARNASRSVFLMSTPHVQLAAQKGSAGKVDIEDFTLQFLEDFDPGRREDFKAKTHKAKTLDQFCVPSMHSTLRVERTRVGDSAQTSVLVASRMSGAQIDVDPRIAHYVFTFIDIFQMSHQRFMALSLATAATTTSEASRQGDGEKHTDEAGKNTENTERKTEQDEGQGSANAPKAQNETLSDTLTHIEVTASFELDTSTIRMHPAPLTVKKGAVQQRKRTSADHKFRRYYVGPEDGRAGAKQSQNLAFDVFKCPGISIWANYQQPRTDGLDDSRLFHLDISVHASQNTLHPTLVPFIMSVLDEVKERARRSTERNAARRAALSNVEQPSPTNSPPPPTSPLLPASSSLAPPTDRSKLQLSVSLKVDESRLEISCEPTAQVLAKITWKSGGFTLTTTPHLGTVHFALRVDEVGMSLRHRFSPEDCLRLGLKGLVASVSYGAGGANGGGSSSASYAGGKSSKGYSPPNDATDHASPPPHTRNTPHPASPAHPLLSIVLSIPDVSAEVNFRHLQDLLCMRMIWFDRLNLDLLSGGGLDASAHAAASPSSPASPAPPSPLLLVIAQANVGHILFQMDLGQAIGRVELRIQQTEGRFRRVPAENRALYLKMREFRVNGLGRLGGFFVVDGMSFETRVNDRAKLRRAELCRLRKGDERAKRGSDDPIAAPGGPDSSDSAPPRVGRLSAETETTPAETEETTSTDHALAPSPQTDFIQIKADLGKVLSSIDYEFHKILLVDIDPVFVWLRDDWSNVDAVPSSLGLSTELRLNSVSVVGLLSTIPTFLLLSQKVELLLEEKQSLAEKTLRAAGFAVTTKSRASVSEMLTRGETAAERQAGTKSGDGDKRETIVDPKNSGGPAAAAAAAASSSPIAVVTRLNLQFERLRLAFSANHFNDGDVFRFDIGSGIRAELIRSEDIVRSTHRDLHLYVGYFSVRKVRYPKVTAQQEADFTVPEWFALYGSATKRNIFRSPTMEVRMVSDQAQGVAVIEHDFSMTYKGQVDLALNYALLRNLTDLVVKYKRVQQEILKRNTQGEGESKDDSAAPGGASGGEGAKEKTPEALVSDLDAPGTAANDASQASAKERAELPKDTGSSPKPVPDAKLADEIEKAIDTAKDSVALETPSIIFKERSVAIDQPQLNFLGDATPPLEWVGLQRRNFPQWIHIGVTVPTEKVMVLLTESYTRRLREEDLSDIPMFRE